MLVSKEHKVEKGDNLLAAGIALAFIVNAKTTDEVKKEADEVMAFAGFDKQEEFSLHNLRLSELRPVVTLLCIAADYWKALLASAPVGENTKNHLLGFIIDFELEHKRRLDSDEKSEEYWASDDDIMRGYVACALLEAVFGDEVDSEEWVSYTNKATANEICEFNIEQCKRVLSARNA